MTNDSNLKTTPLHSMHEELGGKLVPFAGWHMPIQFKGVIQEHQCVRDGVGIFDVSHMGEIEIAGPEAKQLIQYLVTNDIETMQNNQALYALMCLETGGVVDDLLVHRFSDDHYFFCVNASNSDKDFQWILKNASNFNVSVTNTSQQTAQLAVQGKHSEALIQKLCDTPLGEIGYYHFRKAKIYNFECIIARTGYTGEDGFEISISSECVESLARTLLQISGVQPAGLGARDSLRLEAGLCLHGNDIGPQISPVEANIAWAIPKVRRRGGVREGGFPGAAPVLSMLDDGPPRVRVGIRTDGRAPVRAQAPLETSDGKAAGEVTSGGFGPSIGGPVAMAYVAPKWAPPGTRLWAIVRNKHLPVAVAPLPFVPLRYHRS